MKNNLFFRSSCYYFYFTISFNIIFSLFIIIILLLSVTYFNRFHQIIIGIISIIIIFIPLDIIIEYFKLNKKRMILMDNYIIFEEGIFFKKKTIIPLKNIYSISEDSFPICEFFFKTIVLRTIVKDYKMEGVSEKDMSQFREFSGKMK